MKEMSKEQESVKEVQRQVEANLRAFQEECDKLRDETSQIIRQSAHTRIRLALMFNILKAREQGDLAQAAQLTRSLR
ncbi:Heavy metal atpase 2 [Hibiscus syriacus]|uniref:Heavy metal atpase 2 n=1 Tax=Hibiscus syriacus TaxID=106335 RepID=A0A6A2ZMU2_HIBSY|nr:Heavy metal atpase 2 [Hibiscus syriacus]